MIDTYERGRCVRIRGQIYHHDVKIIGDKVLGNWRRKQGHRLDAADIQDILDSRPDVIVIGTGYAGLMKVPPSTCRVYSEPGIRMSSEETIQVVRLFNRRRR